MYPEWVLSYAKEQGYDFMAFTDHQIYYLENFAPETGVLVISETVPNSEEYQPILDRVHNNKNLYTLDYELELHKTILKACGE